MTSCEAEQKTDQADHKAKVNTENSKSLKDSNDSFGSGDSKKSRDLDESVEKMKKFVELTDSVIPADLADPIGPAGSVDMISLAGSVDAIGPVMETGGLRMLAARTNTIGVSARLETNWFAQASTGLTGIAAIL